MTAIAAPIASERRHPASAIVAISIGNALEWFDIVIYGFLAATISKLFFPAGNETVSLLITLGDQGMLLCQRGQKPYPILTVAREVFDVSGAGDTVIASFTLAIAAGASPVEAAIFSNHAAGVVVGKVGTATVSSEELLASFKSKE